MRFTAGLNRNGTAFGGTLGGRTRRARWIGFDPGFICFKPCGRSGRGMETLSLRLDELEALRLADLEGLYQEECARRMGISRTVLSRTLAQARRTVTDALINGKRLVVEPIPAPSTADATAAASTLRPGSPPRTRQPPCGHPGAGCDPEPSQDGRAGPGEIPASRQTIDDDDAEP